MKWNVLATNKDFPEEWVLVSDGRYYALLSRETLKADISGQWKYWTTLPKIPFELENEKS